MPDTCAIVSLRSLFGVNPPAGFRSSDAPGEEHGRRRYSRYLLVVAGLGGLLYGLPDVLSQ
jgi:hypothetical protein